MRGSDHNFRIILSPPPLRSVPVSASPRPVRDHSKGHAILQICFWIGGLGETAHEELCFKTPGGGQHPSSLCRKPLRTQSSEQQTLEMLDPQRLFWISSTLTILCVGNFVFENFNNNTAVPKQSLWRRQRMRFEVQNYRRMEFCICFKNASSPGETLTP